MVGVDVGSQAGSMLVPLFSLATGGVQARAGPTVSFIIELVTSSSNSSRRFWYCSGSLPSFNVSNVSLIIQNYLSIPFNLANGIPDE